MTTTFSPQITTGQHHISHTVEILPDRCAGCQECYVRCPTQAIGFDDFNWIVTADNELCIGCGQCERTCPFSAIFVHGAPETEPSHRHEIAPVPIAGRQAWEETRPGFSNLSQVMAEAARCLQCPDPTCVRGCPAHNNIGAMMRLAAQGDLAGARAVFEQTSHLGSICSRVCNQAAQCEGACSWTLAGADPVAIGLLERFVFDHSPINTPAPKSIDKKVAIVGSGPAAMAASWELVGAGTKVSVYEAALAPGGLLNDGIPEFSLPSSKVREQWRVLGDLGVEIFLGHRVGPDELDSLIAKNDNVILAIGASNPIRPAIPGLDGPNVSDAMEFLAKTGSALHQMRDLPELQGKTILVVGAGNTAMDVARMAIRFGAKPICVEWVNEAFAKVRLDELAEARAEGADVRFCHTVASIHGSRATLVKTNHTKRSKLPKVIEGTEEDLEVDFVILALGYRLTGEFSPIAPKVPVHGDPDEFIDRTWLASGMFHESHNTAIGNTSWSRQQLTDAATRPFANGVYVIGDALIGPSTVVEAMAQGREAGRAIIRSFDDTLISGNAM